MVNYHYRGEKRVINHKFPSMVWGKWLTAQMWACYINKNHPLSDSSLVDYVMLHHSMSYDTTLRNLYLNGKVNNEGFITILWQEKICVIFTSIGLVKRVSQGMTINLRQSVFGIIASTIPLPRIFWKRGLKAVMIKLIPKIIGPKTPTSKRQ